MVLKTFCTLALFFTSLTTLAADIEPHLLGQYEYSLGFDNSYKYLQCSSENLLSISGDYNSLVLVGLTNQPLEFSDIDKGPIASSGPIIGYSQRRTVMTTNNSVTTRVETQNRNCEALLGKIGCLGKKWRTTSWVEFRNYADAIAVQVGYQPFDQSTVEICEFVKK